MRRAILSLAALILVSGCGTMGGGPAAGPTTANRLRLAAVAEANNNVDVALSIYRNAAAADPNNPDVIAQYARALADQGAGSEAVLVIEEALSRRPTERRLILTLGHTHLRLGDSANAAAAFERLREQAPRDADALNGLGVVADLGGEHATAQQRYREALAAAPQHVGVRNNLALSLALSGNTDEAIRLLRQLRAEGNATVRIRHNLGLTAAIAGDAATARQLFGPELSGTDLDSVGLVAAALRAEAMPP